MPLTIPALSIPDDIAVVYRAAGTATAVAKHYGVGRTLALKWLRRSGFDVPPRGCPPGSPWRHIPGDR